MRVKSEMTAQATLAIKNAHLYGEAARRLQHVAVLNETSNAAISASDFDEIARRVVFALKRVLACEINHGTTFTMWLPMENGA